MLRTRAPAASDGERRGVAARSSGGPLHADRAGDRHTGSGRLKGSGYRSGVAVIPRHPLPRSPPPALSDTTSAAPIRRPGTRPPGNPPSSVPGRIATDGHSHAGGTTGPRASAPASALSMRPRAVQTTETTSVFAAAGGREELARRSVRPLSARLTGPDAGRLWQDAQRSCRLWRRTSPLVVTAMELCLVVRWEARHAGMV